MNGIGFKNMKVFKDRQWFDFKPITLLTGTNNSGKSSVINAIQMLQENILSKGLDNLLATEFIVRANQNKYGSIGSFVNNATDNDTMQFEKRIDDYSYIITLRIEKGIQTKGVVKSVEVYYSETNEQIFNIHVDQPYPDLECSFCINYKFFLNKYYNKCEKTISYYDKMDSLKKKIQKLNNGEIKLLEEIEKDIAEIEKEFKLDIFFSNEVDSFILGDDDILEPKQNDGTYKIHQISFKDSNNEYFTLHENDNIKQVVFTYKDEDGIIKKSGDNRLNFRKSHQGVLHQDVFRDNYLNPYKKGILNFQSFWKDNLAESILFNEIICSYYNTNNEEAFKFFCDDWITLCSCHLWKMNYKSIDEDLDPKINLAKKYLTSLIDFGTITSFIGHKKGEEKYHHIPQSFVGIEAKMSILNSPALKILNESGFIDLLRKRIVPIFIDYFVSDDENFTRRKNLIDNNVYKFINKHISSILQNFNLCFDNLYVSSNRFSAKRLYSFNDNSDFTNLLGILENFNKAEDKKDVFIFINKWLSEFEIADELLLKSDIETGNFKAYLRKNNKEILLSDYGLGTNQLLPILLSLSLARFISSKTIMIEEPEANLHPAMQSKLADLFIDANKTFNVQIIAETHSEYLIRKLQYLVGSSKSQMKPSDAVIYYFYKSEHPAVTKKLVNQVEKIEIDEFGRLSKEFGTGFFDEADRIALDIFLLKQSQSN